MCMIVMKKQLTLIILFWFAVQKWYQSLALSKACQINALVLSPLQWFLYLCNYSLVSEGGFLQVFIYYCMRPSNLCKLPLHDPPLYAQRSKNFASLLLPPICVPVHSYEYTYTFRASLLQLGNQFSAVLLGSGSKNGCKSDISKALGLGANLGAFFIF